MKTKKIFLVIADISGYTKFLHQNKISMLHAEHIVCELLESVIDATDNALTYYEHAGDAVMFYAESDESTESAQIIFEQVKGMFKAFKNKQRALANELSMNWKEVSVEVQKLKLKAIVHHGEAVFTKIKNIIKVAGQDVILAHRLLKNSAKTSQYILTTKDFLSVAGNIDESAPQQISEYYEGIGKIHASVYNSISGIFREGAIKRSLIKRLQRLVQFELYYFKKTFWKMIENYSNNYIAGWSY